MGKIEVSALIKAIQESVSLLVSDGIAPRERITDPVNDAARVQDLESGYSTEIDDIVNNIPDVPPTPPGPTLPTVTLATYYTGNYVTSCSPGGFLNLYENSELVPYDSTKTHIARVSDGHGGWNEWQFSCIEYAGDIAVKNMTSDTLSTYAVRLFSCSSTQAEIIYVYNSSNEKYQAFKFTLNETDYYYVADSVQNDWTDDLSSIGYSLEPVSLLPTVTADTAMAGSNRVLVNAGSSVNLYKDSDLIPYDSTKLYGGRVGDGSGGVSRWQFSFINDSNYLCIKNTTNTSIYALGVSYYICSSNQAEIVFVLNSSDVRYQAFKYTQNGTDYYYVLDGVQSDWTDDLSSIGYSLEPTGLYAYFNRNDPGVNTSLFGSSDGSTQYNRLYEKDGSGSASEMSFDPSYTYTVLHVYDADGTEVSPNSGRFELGDSSNYLRFLFFNGGSSWTAAKIEYTKSSTEMTAYFNSGVRNNQKTVSSGWSSGGDQIEVLYPLNSGKTIPYDSTKTYKVKTVFYKNYANPVTITNNYVTIDDLNYAGVHIGYLVVHTHVNNPATGMVCGCTFTVE